MSPIELDALRTVWHRLRKDTIVRICSIFLLTTLLLSCGKAETAASTSPTMVDSPEAISPKVPEKRVNNAPIWELSSADEGASLALMAPGNQTVVRLFCQSDDNTLKVNVQSFTAVSSEERFMIGSGRAALTLVVV